MAKFSLFTAFVPPLPFLILLPLSFFSSSFCFGCAATWICDLLRDHGIPSELLPKTVDSFDRVPSFGILKAWIIRPCYVRYGDWFAFLDSEVRGNLRYGAIRGVEGGSRRRKFFLCLHVKCIVVAYPASGDILFLGKQLPISSFNGLPPRR